MSEAVLKRIDRWWRSLIVDLVSRNPQLTPSHIRSAAQQLIIQILCLQLGKQRNLFSGDQLQALHSAADVYTQLSGLLQNAFGLLLHNEVTPDLRVDGAWLLNALQELEGEAIAVSILGQAYEQCLGYSVALNSVSSNQIRLAGSRSKSDIKKASGVFYTPTSMVDYVVQQTVGKQLEHRAASVNPSSHLPLSILDPACGGGFFLIRAYQQLLDWYLKQYVAALEQPAPTAIDELSLPLCQTSLGAWQLTYSERLRILLTHIHGVDIDPHAVAVTKLSLVLTLVDTKLGSILSSPPDLGNNICCGNALIGFDFEDSNAFDWESAFPHIVRSGGFDVVIGNPPYIDSERMAISLPQWRSYCVTHYETAVGNWDIFCVFIEKALMLSKSGGLISFVVPNKLASADYAAKARSLLTQHNQLLAIRNYARVAPFAAGVYPLVFVVHKGRLHERLWIDYELMDVAKDKKRSLDSQICQSYTVDYARYVANPEQPWLIFSCPQQSNLAARLREGFPGLAEVAQIVGAATVAEAYAIQPLIQECEGVEDCDLEGDFKVVNSGTIDRYQFQWGNKRLRYLGKSYLRPVMLRSLLHQLSIKRQRQAAQPKIIVAGMTRGIECALDSDGSILAAKSTSIIQSAIDLRYLLGVLNSRLIRLYFTSSFGGNSLQGGYLRIGPPQLKQIPIRVVDWASVNEQRMGDRLIAFVDEMLLLNQTLTIAPPEIHNLLHQQIDLLDQQIDQIVYQLYELTDAEIETVAAYSRNESTAIRQRS